MIAIKILNDHYAGYKKLWNLVEKKARKALIVKMGLDAKEISNQLESNPSEIDLCFNRGKSNLSNP